MHSPLWSSQANCLAHTKQNPRDLSELNWTNTATHTLGKDTQALSRPSDVCTVSDNEEDKTHHINYPANTFFQSPVKDCAEACLETYMKPTGVPRHSWVLNLGSRRIACQQPLLQGKKDEEKEYYVYVCKSKKWGGERRGWCPVWIMNCLLKRFPSQWWQ